MSHGITLPLFIDGAPHTAPAVTHDNESGEPENVLMFFAAYAVLEAWQKIDPGHRRFGWTGAPDSTDPENAFAAWIDADGALQIAYLETFFDGLNTLNGYSIDQLTQLPTVTTIQKG